MWCGSAFTKVKKIHIEWIGSVGVACQRNFRETLFMFRSFLIFHGFNLLLNKKTHVYERFNGFPIVRSVMPTDVETFDRLWVFLSVEIWRKLKKWHHSVNSQHLREIFSSTSKCWISRRNFDFIIDEFIGSNMIMIYDYHDARPYRCLSTFDSWDSNGASFSTYPQHTVTKSSDSICKETFK